jgi:hypothetical protein
VLFCSKAQETSTTATTSTQVTATESTAMRLRHGQLIGRNAVPESRNQLKTFLNRQPEDFVFCQRPSHDAIVASEALRAASRPPEW